MRILAIDPGFERLGIAILEDNTLLYSDCLRTSPKEEFYTRLTTIGEEIERVIGTYKPNVCALETLFLKNNQKTAMRVAEARGVVAFTAAKNGLRIFEYSPLQIKMAITSYGRSDKKQMIYMIPKLIKITKEIQYDDEYDAIAVGITCFSTEKSSCKTF